MFGVLNSVMPNLSPIFKGLMDFVSNNSLVWNQKRMKVRPLHHDEISLQSCGGN